MSSGNLVQQAQKGILDYIASTPEIKQLPKEQEFAEILGVSRIVIREALSSLRALGIIETKKKKGTTVVVPDVFGVINTVISAGLLDKTTLRDLYQLRIMLEVGAADFIFMGKNEQNMKELEAIVAKEAALEEEMHKAGTDEERFEVAKRLTKLDFQFHTKLFEITGNKSLIDFQHILRHLFTLYRPKIKKDFHVRNIISHIDLFNVLRTGTPDSFRMAIRLHLDSQIRDMEANIDSTCSGRYKAQ